LAAIVEIKSQQFPEQECLELGSTARRRQVA
jgi:hypothetical protein